MDSMELSEQQLETVSGGIKPNNVGNNVDQYDIQVNKEYYMHYTSGGHDQWIRIRIKNVFEADNGYILWHHCTTRSATYTICTTGEEVTTAVNKSDLIYEINK